MSISSIAGTKAITILQINCFPKNIIKSQLILSIIAHMIPQNPICNAVFWLAVQPFLCGLLESISVRIFIQINDQGEVEGHMGSQDFAILRTIPSDLIFN
jgi:hypothetical protein